MSLHLQAALTFRMAKARENDVCFLRRMGEVKGVSLDGTRRLAAKVATGCALAIVSGAVLGVLLMRGNHKERVAEPASRAAAPALVPVVRQSGEAPSGGVTTKQVSAQLEAPRTVSLSQFVEQNEKLFGVLGVFTAVSVFVGQLRLHWFAYGLSFVFTLLVLLLWIELWSKLPLGTGGWKITVFENLLSLAVIGLVAYLFIDYRDIWHQYLFVPVFLFIYSLIGAVFWWVVKKYNVFDRLFHTVPRRKAFLQYLVIGTSTYYVSNRLAVLITPAVNRVLDALYKALSR